MWTNDKLKTDSGNSQRVDLGIMGNHFFFFKHFKEWNAGSLKI